MLGAWLAWTEKKSNLQNVFKIAYPGPGFILFVVQPTP